MEGMAEFGERLTRIETKIDTIAEDVKEMKDCLYGNGKPGLKTVVHDLEQKQANRDKWFWIFGTVIAGNFVAIVFAIAKNLIVIK